VLPTLAVILWAYGMYALVRAWSRKKNGTLGRSRGRRYALAAFMAGSGAALGAVLWLSLGVEPQEHGLRLAGFLGTVWADGQTERAGGRGEVPQIKGQAPNGQPAYALLHPETPAGELEAVKTRPAPKRLQKPRVKKGSAAPARTAKPGGAQKKEKLAARNQPKSQPQKKKPAAPAAAPAASGG